jgi:hypothetical protein
MAQKRDRGHPAKADPSLRLPHARFHDRGAPSCSAQDDTQRDASLTTLRTAEGLADAFFGAGGSGVAVEVGAVVEGVGYYIEQLLEGLEILFPDGGVERFFDDVVTRDEGGIRGAHGCGARIGRD